MKVSIKSDVPKPEKSLVMIHATYFGILRTHFQSHFHPGNENDKIHLRGRHQWCPTTEKRKAPYWTSILVHFDQYLTSRWSRWHQILCPHLQTWLWCLMRYVMFYSSWNDMCDIFDCVQVSFSVWPHVPITFVCQMPLSDQDVLYLSDHNGPKAGHCKSRPDHPDPNNASGCALEIKSHIVKQHAPAIATLKKNLHHLDPQFTEIIYIKTFH